MTDFQIVIACYLVVGLVRSYFLTSYLRSLVEHPVGGWRRALAVYLLLVVIWLPAEGLIALTREPDPPEGA